MARHGWLMVALVLLGMSLAPLAASAHTKDEETACRPDVFRLCSRAIPNQTRIVACLAQNKRQLSSACFKVFDREPTARSVAPAKTDAEPVQWGR